MTVRLKMIDFFFDCFGMFWLIHVNSDFQIISDPPESVLGCSEYFGAKNHIFSGS